MESAELQRIKYSAKKHGLKLRKINDGYFVLDKDNSLVAELGLKPQPLSVIENYLLELQIQNPKKQKKRQKILRRKILKTCVICGREFEARHGTAKYCSHECRNKAAVKYYHDHREHKRTLARGYYDKYQRRPTKKKTCRICGREFETQFPQQKCCSKACQKKHLNERQNKMRHSVTYTYTYKKVCPICGKEFEAKSNYKKYCSDACRVAAIEKKTCPICGKEFQPRQYNQTCCSESCRRKSEYARKHGYKKPYVKTCAKCGKTFETNNNKRIYCSDACCQKVAHENERARKNLPPILEVKKCKICGAEFKPKQHTQVCCSPECTAKNMQELSKDAQARLRAAKLKERLKALQRADEEANERLAISKLPVIRIENTYKPLEKKAPPKNESTLEKLMREAQECGLSYGKYRAALAQGKTYEELKTAYEKNCVSNVEKNLPPFLQSMQTF